MILLRDVFQARYGQGGELVRLFQEAAQNWPGLYAGRVLTDLSGAFFTVVTETEFASLADYEQHYAELLAKPDFGAWFARMSPLVERGHREFYTVEGRSGPADG